MANKELRKNPFTLNRFLNGVLRNNDSLNQNEQKIKEDKQKKEKDSK